MATEHNRNSSLGIRSELMYIPHISIMRMDMNLQELEGIAITKVIPAFLISSL